MSVFCRGLSSSYSLSCYVYSYSRLVPRRGLVRASCMVSRALASCAARGSTLVAKAASLVRDELCGHIQSCLWPGTLSACAFCAPSIKSIDPWMVAKIEAFYTDFTLPSDSLTSAFPALFSFVHLILVWIPFYFLTSLPSLLSLSFVSFGNEPPFSSIAARLVIATPNVGRWVVTMFGFRVSRTLRRALCLRGQKKRRKTGRVYLCRPIMSLGQTSFYSNWRVPLSGQ